MSKKVKHRRISALTIILICLTVISFLRMGTYYNSFESLSAEHGELLANIDMSDTDTTFGILEYVIDSNYQWNVLNEKWDAYDMFIVQLMVTVLLGVMIAISWKFDKLKNK